LTGDKLGALVALFLEPDFAAVPISTNDAVISVLKAKGIGVTQTKIGSPYVIKAMIDELAKNPGSKVVSWESNGGFLLGSDWTIGGKTLKALPTRDAILPLVAVMLEAIKEDKTISRLISSSLPKRYTHADVIDDKTEGCTAYTAEMGKKIVEKFSVPEGKNDERFKTVKESLSKYFNKGTGFSEIASINSIDGVRIVFGDNKVAHLRPSGNAPEFRMYATADTQQEAEEIVEKRLVIMPMMISDMTSSDGEPRSLGAHAEGEGFGEEGSGEKVIDALSRGIPLYIRPYEEPKVWGVKGIGEYWYGAEAGEKSSEVVCGKSTAKAIDILKADPEKFLGKGVVERFGERLPLVKILTPKGRLSVQFHDSKNELWIVTGIDASLCGAAPEIILGFSQDKVNECGTEITEKYKKALKQYGKALNSLIDLLEGDDEGKEALKQEKDVLNAAQKMAEKTGEAQEGLDELIKCRKEIDRFYEYRTVKIGDVIPVPSGTLHALGPGIEVVEPQIAGPTQSLEDGETYPVRYYFPGFEREGAQKRLDIDRIGEMDTSGKMDSSPEVIENKGDATVERLPGNFSDKGLEVHRVTLKKGGIIEKKDITSFHNLVTVSGKAKVAVAGSEYEVPEASPGGNMLIIPASAGNFTIISCGEEAQIIDTFTPLF